MTSPVSVRIRQFSLAGRRLDRRTAGTAVAWRAHQCSGCAAARPHVALANATPTDSARRRHKFLRRTRCARTHRATYYRARECVISQGTADREMPTKMDGAGAISALLAPLKPRTEPYRDLVEARQVLLAPLRRAERKRIGERSGILDERFRNCIHNRFRLTT